MLKFKDSKDNIVIEMDDEGNTKVSGKLLKEEKEVDTKEQDGRE